jgi:hypothetical protein
MRRAITRVSRCKGGRSEAAHTKMDKNAIEEMHELACAMARVPTHDLHGLQMKAGVYAQLIGAELLKRPQTAAQAVLLSLICDLLRGTEWEVLLERKKLRREFPAIRSSGQATVEVIPLELRRLQQLALADDFMAELVGDFAQTSTPRERLARAR